MQRPDDIEEERARARVARRLIGESTDPIKVGRYVVLDQIGSGALGVVYLAYDPELDRRVAVKLVRSDRLIGERAAEVQSRLQREAQAIARVSHPNVVHVYDVGTQQGQVFVAMELIDGPSLRDWFEHEPPWRQVLNVFRQAGRGLAAAHDEGVIHRDFKPDNVLVGPQDRVVVVDFGLARAVTDAPKKPVSSLARTSLDVEGKQLESPLTQTGMVMGTPAYMAPEQFAGEPTDTRTDQFSYCVALFEGLYGCRPFAGETTAALQDAVSSGNVRHTSATSGVPAWVHRIVLRGLSVEPSERYPSMEALLADLARDPARKQKRLAAVTVAAAAIGIGGWGLRAGLSTDAQRCPSAERALDAVWDQARMQTVRDAFLATQVPAAEATFDRVSTILDDYSGRWIAMASEACVANRIVGEQSDELFDRRMVCLGRRLSRLRALVDILSEADETGVERAVYAVASLPMIDGCADVEALMARVAPPEDPLTRKLSDDLRDRLADAEALENAGRYEAGLTLARQLSEEAKAIGHAPLEAEASLTLGNAYEEWGDAESAARWLEDAYYQGDAAGHDEVKLDAATKLVFVAGGQQGDYDDAARWGELASAAAVRSALHDHPSVAMLHNNLGLLHYWQGDHSAALEQHQIALEMRQRLRGESHYEVAMSLNNLANSLPYLGRAPESVGYYRRAIQIVERELGPDHSDNAYPWAGLGTSLLELGRPQEALEAHERSLALASSTKGGSHIQVVTQLIDVAASFRALGRHAQADLYVRRALAVLDRAGSYPMERSRADFLLAATMWELGANRDQARDLVETARAALARHPEAAQTLRDADEWLAEHPADSGRRAGG